MRSALLLLAILANLIAPANAGPLFGTNGGIGSATSSFLNGEPRGGTYSINGATGVIAAANIPSDPRAFGAKCDGATDDTTALQAWLTAATAGAHLLIPNSTCVFKSALTFPKVNFLTIDGAGKASKLLYAGTSTTATLVTMGVLNDSADGYCSIRGWTIKDFRVESSTTMTAGDGVLLADACSIDISNFYVGADLDDIQYATTLFNGFHLVDNITTHIRGFVFTASNAAHIVNGESANQATDIYEYQGLIEHGKVGLDIAGNVGGFFLDATDVLLNGTEISIDQSQVAVPNGSLFFGPLVSVDATSGSASAANQGISLTDPGTAFGSGQGSLLLMSGTWLASSTVVSGVTNSGVCLNVGTAAVNWDIIWAGGTAFNCQLDAVQVNNAAASVSITGTRIKGSGRYGVNASVANPNIQLTGVAWPTSSNLNGSGNLGGYATNRLGYLTPLGSFSGALSVAQLGSSVQLSGNLTLPTGLGANLGKGGTLYIYNPTSATYSVTVGNTASDFIFDPVNGWGTTTRSISLSAGQTLALVSLGANEWDVIGGSAALGNAVANSYQAIATTFGGLPPCNTASQGTASYITDASAAITAWHQQVTAGGGANKAFVTCNGSGWFAYNY